MITFDAFFNLINNTSWDTVDPSNRDQCFDLAVGYCKSLGLPTSIFSGILLAKDLWYKPNDLMKQTFTFIPNSPTGVPQKGDIVVFDGSVGHVSVATGKGDVNSFESFDENFPTGSNCHLVTHDYVNPKVLGWLRFKGTLPTDQDTQTIDQLKHTIEDMKQTEIRLQAEMTTALADKDKERQRALLDQKTKIKNYIDGL